MLRRIKWTATGIAIPIFGDLGYRDGLRSISGPTAPSHRRVQSSHTGAERTEHRVRVMMIVLPGLASGYLHRRDVLVDLVLLLLIEDDALRLLRLGGGRRCGAALLPYSGAASVNGIG